MRITGFKLGTGLGCIGAADAVSGSGGDAQPYSPAAYLFSDSFDSGASALRKRSGWQLWTPDRRVADAFTTSGGTLHTDNFGYGGDVYGLTDTGRTDSLFWQGTLAAFPNGASLALRALDRDNYVYVLVKPPGTSNVEIGCYGLGSGSPSNSLLIRQARNNQPNDVWRFEINADTLVAFVNGARWPDAATSWTVSSVLRSGKAGFAAFNGAGGTWDDVSTGYLGTTPLVRLTLDPVRRLYQRAAGTTARPLAVSGTHSGLNTAPECRLLNAVTGAVVSGWNWGQKPLVGFTQDATSWSATTAPVPQGDGYLLQVRDPQNVGAGSTSRKFGVGIVIATYGQSNSVGMWAGAVGAAQPNAHTFLDPSGAVGGQPAVADAMFDATTTTAYGTGQIAGILAAAAGVPVGIVVGGAGGQPIANLTPGSSYTLPGWTKPIWAAFEDSLAAAGGDLEAIVYTQGESDAGPDGGPGLSAGVLASYKTGLDAIYARIRALTGRSAAQLPFVIHGLGRVVNKANGSTTSPNWRDLRRAQFEWCRDTAGALLGSGAIDVTYNSGESPAWHRSLDATGYGEDAKRIGAALKKLSGLATTDRRGPLPTGIARGGNTIVVTFDANGASALTCTGAIASNFEFATDASFATPLTPSAMTINGPTQVTFNFASPPPAGTAMRGPTGINPDVAGALKGMQTDGTSVMSWPVFDSLVAA